VTLGIGDEGEGGGMQHAGGEGLEVRFYPVVGRRSGGNVESEEAVEDTVVGELGLKKRCGLEEACTSA
jgi:hypothetical protein